MDHIGKTYTAAQIAVAANGLRNAAGAASEEFPLEQAVSMLSDEVRMLRERGLSDERIAGLFTTFEIEAKPEDITRFYTNTSSWGG